MKRFMLLFVFVFAWGAPLVPRQCDAAVAVAVHMHRPVHRAYWRHGHRYVWVPGHWARRHGLFHWHHVWIPAHYVRIR